MEKPRTDIIKLFQDKEMLKIAAPMVRYSKLQFRSLMREYNCDICFTPMILADSFHLSRKARNVEFTTNLIDSPLIVQFASNNVDDFMRSTKIVSPFCDGVDLNCGCPQRWAKQMGIGCAMLEKPEIIKDIVSQCRNQISRPFSVSVKMRIFNDVKRSIELCRQLDKCGVSFLSVHSRTSSQLTGDINVEALKLIAENVSCPTVANGGVKTLRECEELQRKTNCKGVMVANGILSNPMLFTGANKVKLDCIQRWTNLCYNSTIAQDNYLAAKENDSPTILNKSYNLTFQCFHHHLVFMLEKILPRAKRRIFNSYRNFNDVLNFLRAEFNIVPQLFDPDEFEKYKTIKLDYDDDDLIDKDNVDQYEYDENDGKYFTEKIKEEESFGIENIFTED